jgi:hypothetical protein
MKKLSNCNKNILEHIIPIDKQRHIYIYGLDNVNRIKYSYSDAPDVIFYDVIEPFGAWIYLGELKLPGVYFKKYLKVEA